MGKNFLQVVFFCFGKGKVVKEILDGSQTCEDDVLAGEGVLSEEDFESGGLFVFVADEVGVGASELIQVGVEESVFAKHWFLI